ncbi:hypothetical protein BG011_002215 [Mortierella polycephala]|uniref:RecQ-mediated genome instability protein 1 n=1 Tax=Mortierella polycephala TaxID=41804 RepID=A0A9P6Q3R8_9FUNG|nr:hypothetical protein BG011_002215 [Mortierella polycephala]
MTNDDLLVRNAIQRMGVNASIEWTRQCIAFKQKQDATNGISAMAAFDKDMAQFVFEMYLLADLRTLDPKPTFPSSISTPHMQRLFTDMEDLGGFLSKDSGGAILQILEIQDIGISSLKMLEACETIGVAGEQPGGFQVGKALPRGMIALDLTDGLRKMRAIVMEPITGIAMEMKLGAKIRIKDVDVRHGVLQLLQGNTLLLGGEIASMNQHPRRLVIMNQMKKRLGLPLDPLPISNGSEVAVVTAAAVSQTIAPTSSTTALTTMHNGGNTSNVFNNRNDSSHSNNTNLFGGLSNGWKNPQSAVREQDAVPSAALSFKQNSESNHTSASTGGAYNPWKSFKAIRDSLSPPPSPPPLALERKQQEELDSYRQMQRDQEPQWNNLDHDMELDGFALPGDDRDWEVMSQLSVDDKHLDSSGQNRTTARNSPPLIATTSPAKRGLTPRRSLSLRAPHSQKSQQQHMKPEDPWEIGDNPFLIRQPQSDRNSEESENNKDQDPEKDAFYLNRKSFSPISNANSRKGATKEGSPPLHDLHNFDFPQDNYDTYGQEADVKDDFEQPVPQDTLPPPLNYDMLLKRGYEGNGSEMVFPNPAKGDQGSREGGKKRKISPEQAQSDNKDIFPDWRRSRSFSASPWIEEDVKVKVEVDKASDTLVRVKTEAHGDEGMRISDINRAIKKEPGTNDSRAASPSLSVVKVKIEAAEVAEAKIAQGASYHAAIDLSSDDDNETIHSLKVKPEVHIKREETLLEFDMDDEDDFGGLNDVVHVVPEVNLDQVENAVREQQEAKAKARVHKLGKFSLTTLAVSIPITLLPVHMPLDTEASKVMLEAVLDQGVVERLLEHTLAQFRDLVLVNESRAREAVKTLRNKLSEVETVECYFRGLRTDIPVIRELKILSRKRK